MIVAARLAYDRFTAKHMPEPNSGCWLWLGGATEAGYGTMFLDGTKTTAQRVSWLLYRGTLPEGMEVDHKCLNPSCVNPDHLRLLTKSQNLALRRFHVPTHCPAGHAYDETNTAWEMGARGRPVKRCRVCRRARTGTKG